MTMNDNHADDDLALFFAAAKAQPPEASEALLARVLDEGLALQQARLAPVARPSLARPSAARPGLLARMVAAVGGWGAATGLASAALCGLWIGLYPPATLAGLADLYLGTSVSALDAEVDQIDLLPSFDSLMTEG